MADDPSQDALITQFCSLTGAPPQQAVRFLNLTDGDLSAAVSEFYTSQEEEEVTGEGGGAEPEPEPLVPEGYTGPRTLDGRPAPTSAIPTVGSSSRAARQPPRKGIATLGSLNQGGGSHGHDHDDDDDSDDEDYNDGEQPRDLFAGGEKSGLAVQDPPRRNDPNSIINDIKRAVNAKKPATEPSKPATTSRFRGTGMTLGGDDTPSEVVSDPNAPAESAQGPVQNRVLHLWNDGFSIEDGPLHRFDDPRNAADIQVIRSGRAPIHLMNVLHDQPVDVQLNKHDENYKPPPKVYKPFSGGGHRLGAPTPGSSSRSTAPPAPAPAPAITPSVSAPEVELSPDQPTLTIRIQLANGTRLPARFNPSHTIGDVYGFVERAYPGSNSRPWVLATTFPNKDHTDRSTALSDVPEFKKGGTAVQKWT